MFKCAGIIIRFVIVVGYELYLIVTMAVTVVVNYVLQNFQCANALIVDGLSFAY